MTNKARYDEALKDQGGFYKAIGAMGGRKSKPTSNAFTPETAAAAGRKGGTESRRSTVTLTEEQLQEARRALLAGEYLEAVAMHYSRSAGWLSNKMLARFGTGWRKNK